MAAGWLAGLDPGGEATWSGDGSWKFPGPYSQTIRTAGLQDYRITGLEGRAGGTDGDKSIEK